MLAIYELNDVALLRDLFVWAYERSTLRYRAIRQSMGEPDAFRLEKRDQIKEVVAQIVCHRMSRKEALQTAKVAASSLPKVQIEKFTQIVEEELDSLHEGNVARYRLRPSEFRGWTEGWDRNE